jgi:hypothetical protein
MKEVKQFVRNCDFYRQNKSWTDKRQKFFKFLFIPDRIWKEIFIDFITDLPENEKYTNLMIITDYLNKKIILEVCSNMQTEIMIEKFLRSFYRYYRISVIIISDRDR